MATRKSRLKLWAKRVLLLLGAPLAVALVANIVSSIATFQHIAWWFWVVTGVALVIAILLYCVVYTRILDNKISSVEMKLRSRRYRKPSVLILDGTLYGYIDEHPPNPVQTSKSSYDWQDALTRLGWNVIIGPVWRVVEGSGPDIVVNPFGEVYPEKSFISHETAYAIREYVWNGGIYVNVAGIPFWYSYNPQSKKGPEVAGRMERRSDQPDHFKWKALFKVLFPNLTTKEGGSEQIECLQNQDEIERFGNIVEAGQSKEVLSFRAYTSDVSGQMIPLLRSADQDYIVIGSILFGAGCFLLAGVKIGDTSSTFEKVVAAIKGWAEYESRGRRP